MGWNTFRRKPAVLPGHSGKRLAASGLTSRKKSGRCFLHTCRKYKQITARTVKVIKRLPSGIGSQKSQSSCLVPYYQAAGLPYCSPPAREYPSRLRLHKRHDTNGRWRQVTKLPRPCPQYPPFTLRYGNMLVLLYWRLMAVPALPHAGHRPSGLPLVPLKSSCLTGQARQEWEKQLPSLILPAPAGSHRARAWAACFTAPHSRRNLNTGYEQGFTLLFSNVRKREQNPLIM